MNNEVKAKICSAEKDAAKEAHTAPTPLSDEEAAKVSGGAAPRKIRDEYSRGEHFVERDWL